MLLPETIIDDVSRTRVLANGARLHPRIPCDAIDCGDCGDYGSCSEGVCARLYGWSGRTCLMMPAANCHDGIKNGNEMGLDCGVAACCNDDDDDDDDNN